MAIVIHHQPPGDICAFYRSAESGHHHFIYSKGKKSKMQFQEAFEEILKIEGEVFTNLPLDRGGPTKFGITFSALKENGLDNPKVEDVQNLTKDQAALIYRSLYWDKLKLDQIKSGAIQHVLFDQAINRGPGTAVMQIQKILSKDGPISVDGSMGPTTIARINAKDPKDLLWDFFRSSQLSYCSIVEEDGSQAVFIKGWITRTQNLMASAQAKL